MSPKLPEPQKATQQASRRETQPASVHSFQGGLHPILQLQRTLGNRQVAQLIKARRLTPEGRIIGGRIIALQPRLTVGAADDQYEQEADRVARQVVSMPDSAIFASSPQASPVEEDTGQRHTLQSKPLPLAASITPLAQRQIGAEEESEEGQDKEEDKEGLLQARFINKSSALSLRRQPATEREDAEEAEPIQARSAGPLSDSFEAGDDVESRLNQSKGGGSLLPDAVRAYMEPRFGVDFSHVRVHTGSDAIQMNRDVGAQAFTHGSDIYYGAGSSPNNLELTAHELTHVVQQDSEHVIARVAHTIFRQSAASGTPGGPDPCLDLFNEIVYLLDEVARRINQALDDALDLYRYRPGPNPEHSGGGTWPGHRDRFYYDRDRLRHKIAEWDSNDDCRGYPLRRQQQEDLGEAREFGEKEFPESPLRTMQEGSQREAAEPTPEILPSTSEQIIIFARMVLETGIDAEQAAEEFLRRHPELATAILALGIIGIIALIADDATLAGIADDVLIPIIATLMRVAWRFSF